VTIFDWLAINFAATDGSSYSLPEQPPAPETTSRMTVAISAPYLTSHFLLLATIKRKDLKFLNWKRR